MERRTYTLCGTDETVELTERDRLIKPLGDDKFNTLDGSGSPVRAGIKGQTRAIDSARNGPPDRRVFWLNEDGTVEPLR